MTKEQMAFWSDFLGYSFEIDGDNMRAKAFDKAGNFLYSFFIA